MSSTKYQNASNCDIVLAKAQDSLIADVLSVSESTGFA